MSSAFVSRRHRQSPRVSEGITVSLPSGDFLSSASACVSAWHPRAAETRHLPPCPCLAPSPPPVTERRWLRTFLKLRKVRERISGRVRTRPGRIRSSFHRKDDRTVWDLANNPCGSHHTQLRKGVTLPADRPPAPRTPSVNLEMFVWKNGEQTQAPGGVAEQTGDRSAD